MTYKEKRNRVIYWLFLLLYTAALLFVVCFVLRTLWDFAQEYEKAQPEKVIDSYVAQLNNSLWEQGLEETVAAMEHPYQTDEECRAIIMEMLDGEVSYFRSTSTDPSMDVYTLCCGENSFGRVYLRKDETKKGTYTVLDKEITLPWDLRPWIVDHDEFDLTGLYTSVEVTAPSNYTVQLNGKTLGAETIIEDGIEMDSLKEYYDVNPNLPKKCTYRAEHVIGQLSPVILDDRGQEFRIDPTKDDSQFLRECPQEELVKLDAFMKEFCEPYFRFISGIYKQNSAGAYGGLSQYVLAGSDLDIRLQGSLDGLSWAHTYSFNMDSYSLLDAMNLGGGYYVCNVKVGTTTGSEAHGVVSDEREWKFLVLENEGAIKAVSII